MPWDDELDPVEALRRFPVSVRNMPRRDTSQRDAYARALADIDRLDPASIPYSTYLLVLMSPHLGVLSQDMLWRVYTGFVVAAAGRIQITPQHLDMAVQHLMRQYFAAPCVSKSLYGPRLPAPRLAGLARERMEHILRDYELLGYRPTAAALSARIICAAGDGDAELAHQIFDMAHAKQGPELQQGQDGAERSRVEDSDANELDNDSALKDDLISNPAPEQASGAPGLTLEGYNAYISMLAWRMHSTGHSNISTSFDRLPSTMAQEDSYAAPKHNHQPQPTTNAATSATANVPKLSQNMVWRTVTEMRRMGIEPSRITYEMWLYLFGRLGDSRGVTKNLTRLRAKHIARKSETMHVALDAIAETRLPRKWAEHEEQQLGRRGPGRMEPGMLTQLLTARTKYFVAIGDSPRAWSVLRAFDASKIPLNSTAARLLALAGILDHADSPETTADHLGRLLQVQLAAGSELVEPAVWLELIDSYFKYSADAFPAVALNALRTLCIELVPAWTDTGAYGFGASGPLPLPVEAGVWGRLAYMLGRTFNASGLEMLLQLLTRTEMEQDRIESHIAAFMSGWVDGGGDADELRTRAVDAFATVERVRGSAAADAGEGRIHGTPDGEARQ
nr:hypothetical protein HK105_000361 [Polyrhizophydium stewartii]